MNDKERRNVRSSLDLWKLRMLCEDAYPVLMFALPAGGDNGKWLMLTSASFPAAHLKSLLREMADNLPDGDTDPGQVVEILV